MCNLPSIIYTPNPQRVPLVLKRRSGGRELLLCLEPSLGNEVFGSSKHTLLPFGKADALLFNLETKRPTVLGLFPFQALTLAAGVGVLIPGP